MNISLFYWNEGATQQAHDRAMEFLREGDAYIIDIRGTGGGSPLSVNYLTSHLMDPGQKIMTYVERGEQSESRTRTDLGARRLPVRPLFLLTGPGSASAAEEFAAHVKNFRLGTLVGQTTAGAGNRNVRILSNEGFTISISAATAIHPVTNRGWEGTGIEPDLRAPVPTALDVAHREALRRLHANASGPAAAQLRAAIEMVSARIDPVELSQADLLAFSGSYGGDRRISNRAGKLYYHIGPAEWELLPMGNELFAVVSGPPLRVRFAREQNRVTGLTQVSPSGAEERFPRT